MRSSAFPSPHTSQLALDRRSWAGAGGVCGMGGAGAGAGGLFGLRG